MKTRVLIVDDDQAMCELCADGLAKSHEVVWRTDPEAALSVLRDERIDVLVTDVRMKGMSGIDLCRAAIDIEPSLPVIVMTAFGSLESAVVAMRAGAHDYVTKPVRLDVLGLAIDRAAHARSLQEEVKRLRGVVRDEAALGTIVGVSASISRVKDLVARVAPSDASVLITGESGTGKEVVARAIHAASGRSGRPLVAFNCAAMPESLIESELFGHEKGAFTDAKSAHAGLFVQAHGGTLFLDEIGDMPLGLQPKLLRALQERRVRPVGGTSEVAFDVRVLAATNKDLEEAVAAKLFREDLYYRFNVVEVALPPLRARRDDILPLAQLFLERFARATKKAVTGLSPHVAEKLLAYGWPGNVRELANAIERAVALTTNGDIVVDDLPDRVRAQRPHPTVDSPEEIVTLEELERSYVLRVFEKVGRNRSLTSEILGIDRKTLYRKLERWGGGGEA